MNSSTPPAPFQLEGERELRFDTPHVMGIVNVTPDSFSDGGAYLDCEAAVSHALTLAKQGASILDVGGESTRPGSVPVSPTEQCERVLPVIRGIREVTDLPISIDTTSARVAGAALEAGADIVNDISAFRFDPSMIGFLAERGCPAIAMHTLDKPATMQRSPRYGDVLSEVLDHLRERVSVCEWAGVPRERLMIDPGIGFGKTLQHNLSLLQGLPTLAGLGLPLLVGTSRKRFLGELTGRSVEARDTASAVAAGLSVAYGAHVVRVHDVAGGVDAVRVAHAIRQGASAR